MINRGPAFADFRVRRLTIGSRPLPPGIAEALTRRSPGLILVPGRRLLGTSGDARILAKAQATTSQRRGRWPGWNNHSRCTGPIEGGLQGDAAFSALIARYPGSAMATRKINLTLDEELVRRARRQDTGEADKSDVQVVEDALAVYLGLRTLQDARAQGTLGADEADRLAVQEVRAVRRARRQAA